MLYVVPTFYMVTLIQFLTPFLLIEFCRIEEFVNILFPEESQTTNLNILEATYKWKKQKLSFDC